MSKETMIQQIAEYFKTQPVLKAYLFGSYSRGEETDASDIDILIVLDDNQHVGLKFFGMYEDLKELLGRNIDLVTDRSLAPFARESVDRDKILIYERAAQRQERLEHMLAAAERVIRYTSNKDFDDLKADDMMYYAVVKNIEIIGEAANLLSPEFVASHSDTPWKQVRGMRNYIVHEYFQIDDVVVWGVVTTDIPVLRSQIIEYLSEF